MAALFAPSCDSFIPSCVHFICNYCVTSCDSVNASRFTHCSFLFGVKFLWFAVHWVRFWWRLNIGVMISILILQHFNLRFDLIWADKLLSNWPANPIIISNVKATSHHSPKKEMFEISIVKEIIVMIPLKYSCDFHLFCDLWQAMLYGFVVWRKGNEEKMKIFALAVNKEIYNIMANTVII